MNVSEFFFTSSMNCLKKNSLYVLEKIKVMYNVSEKCPHSDVIFFGKLSDSDLNSKNSPESDGCFRKRKILIQMYFSENFPMQMYVWGKFLRQT